MDRDDAAAAMARARAHSKAAREAQGRPLGAAQEVLVAQER